MSFEQEENNEVAEDFKEAGVATGAEEETEEEESTEEYGDEESEIAEEGDEDEEGEEGVGDGGFQFDRKIKVMDDEVEIPEHLASAVKTEEQAKELKELFEKAHGLEPLKQKRDYFKEQATNFEAKYRETTNELSTLEKNLDFLDGLIQNGDLQTFQQYAKIDDEQILKRAAEIIQYRELTPQQKAEYDRNVQSRQRLYQVEAEYQSLSQTQEQAAIQQSQAALDAVLNSDDYREVAASFDQRMGYGAFQKEVIQRAAMKEKMSGQTMTPEEAVKEVVNLLGLSQGQSKNPQATTNQVTSKKNPDSTIVTKKKPTIPKVGGGSKNPARPVVKSLDDIRKLADSMDY